MKMHLSRQYLNDNLQKKNSVFHAQVFRTKMSTTCSQMVYVCLNRQTEQTWKSVDLGLKALYYSLNFSICLFFLNNTCFLNFGNFEIVQF